MSSLKLILTSRAAGIGLLAGLMYGLTARLMLAYDDTLGGGMLAMTIGFLFLVPVTIGYLTVRPVPAPTVLFRIFAPWLTCALVLLGCSSADSKAPSVSSLHRPPCWFSPPSVA